jgi:GNAT superfamily N-acetyltransferase
MVGWGVSPKKRRANEMEIRYATEGDLYRIAEMTRALTLHLGAIEWSVENHLKHVTRRFSNPRYVHLVAVEDDKAIGFTGAELKSRRTAYMLKGYVEPEYRRRGVMRQLEGKLVEILRERGVSKIDLIEKLLKGRSNALTGLPNPAGRWPGFGNPGRAECTMFR